MLVSPGVYYENLQLRGRNIVLSSRFWRDKNPERIEQTIVDGSQLVHADTASCLLIWKGESAQTVIEGFTFRGGRGTAWFDHYVPGTFREGGGILVEFSSPVIQHNIIRDNTVTPGGTGIISVGGGGIWCGDGAPIIENNFLYKNNGTGGFTLVTNDPIVQDGQPSDGATWADYDNDGDLDCFVANCYKASQPDYLYENHAAETSNHWLQIRCVGTISNRSAMSAKVWTKAIIGGKLVEQLREISAQSGYCGQNQCVTLNVQQYAVQGENPAVDIFFE